MTKKYAPGRAGIYQRMREANPNASGAATMKAAYALEARIRETADRPSKRELIRDESEEA